MLHDRNPVVETKQSMDQINFGRGTGIDPAFAVFKTVCGKNIKLIFEIWFGTLNLTKPFNHDEHGE